MICSRKLGGSVLLLFAVALTSGCGSKDQTSEMLSATKNGVTLPLLTGANVLPLTVNGSLCSSSSYPNKPCVSVTVCVPGTSTCQTVSDILVDTGSTGLRVFSSALNQLTLSPTTISGGTLAECAQFGSGSDWGPIAIGDVVLGGEPAVSVPIQLIDSNFATASTVSSLCPGADTSVSDAGFNGILGVGLFKQDCGSGCASVTNNRTYYTCTGATCSGVRVPLVSQVQNPVNLLPVDNNGVIVELPYVPSGGVRSAGGYLVLGIGTSTNNIPTGVTTYQADSSGEFTTVFNGTSYDSFIDSGSNGYYFPQVSGIANCSRYSSNLSNFLCPTSQLSLTAITESFNGSVSSTVPFLVGNFYQLYNASYNAVFSELAGSTSGSLNGLFDWGLPFHLGRNTYVGIQGKTSSLGTGPYWAY